MVNGTATVEVGVSCLFRANRKPFLLIEIDVTAPGVEIEPVIIIRLTEAQFRSLRAGGIPLCRIVEQAPAGAEFRCVFIEGETALLVFEVENATEQIFLVRVSKKRAERLIAKGARRCTVIRRPFVSAEEEPVSGDQS